MPLHNLMALDSVLCFPNDYQLDSEYIQWFALSRTSDETNNNLTD